MQFLKTLVKKTTNLFTPTTITPPNDLHSISDQDLTVLLYCASQSPVFAANLPEGSAEGGSHSLPANEITIPTDLTSCLFTCDMDTILSHVERVNKDKTLYDDYVEIVRQSQIVVSDAQIDGKRKLAASNAITVLNFGSSLGYFPSPFVKTKDWSGIRIPGANLSKAHLSSINFSNADLSQVIFKDATITRSNFSGAILRNATTGAMPVMEGSDGEILRLEYSSDGKYVATGSNDGTVRLWDTSSNTCTKIFYGDSLPTESLRFSRNSRFLAVTDFKKVKVYDLDTMECIRTLRVNPNASECYCGADVDNSGELVVVASRLSFYNLDYDCIKMFNKDEEKWSAQCMLRYNSPNNPRISTDGRFAAGMNHDQLFVWDATGTRADELTPKSNFNFERTQPVSLEFSDDSEKVYCSMEGSKEVICVDARTKQETRIPIPDNGTGFVLHDNRYMAVVDEYSNVRIWDRNDGKYVTSYPFHVPGTQIRISPDRKKVVCICLDKTNAIQQHDLTLQVPSPGRGYIVASTQPTLTPQPQSGATSTSTASEEKTGD